ncbi:prostaglandin E2 receptor EP4 subtype-like [Saccostrea echinata]|uniref:prostaglandin E2 receptor EP4 subtype-like n=1 Tax=Saccostrea echinata TaxID=191078 RepID=UPI002A7EC67B|nr:prostaglandin E2 receptor EP4 subtype-like [Saccostrea echinata]
MSSNQTNSSTLNSIGENPNVLAPVILLILGAIGNGLAFAILCRLSSDHQWRPFYRFVCVLTINDFFGVVLAAPFGIARYASNFTFTFTQPLCDYMAFIQMLAILNSAFIVFSMSLDRFFAIVFPFKYSTSSKERRAHVLLILGGILSVFLSSVHILAGRQSRSFYPGSWCFVDFKSDSWIDRGISLAYSTIGFILLSLIMVLNCTVIITLLRQSFVGSEVAKQRISSKNSKQMIVLLLAVVVLFAICIIPLLINIFARSLRILDGMDNFELIGLRLAYTNAVLNPWLYILIRKETILFLQKLLILRKCRSTKEEQRY